MFFPITMWIFSSWPIFISSRKNKLWKAFFHVFVRHNGASLQALARWMHLTWAKIGYLLFGLFASCSFIDFSKECWKIYNSLVRLVRFLVEFNSETFSTMRCLIISDSLAKRKIRKRFTWNTITHFLEHVNTRRNVVERWEQDVIAGQSVNKGVCFWRESVSSSSFLVNKSNEGDGDDHLNWMLTMFIQAKCQKSIRCVSGKQLYSNSICCFSRRNKNQIKTNYHDLSDIGITCLMNALKR